MALQKHSECQLYVEALVDYILKDVYQGYSMFMLMLTGMGANVTLTKTGPMLQASDIRRMSINDLFVTGFDTKHPWLEAKFQKNDIHYKRARKEFQLISFSKELCNFLRINFESKAFAPEWDIEYKFVSSRYPKSNGLVEIRSNLWDAQLTVPSDPRYARLETNLGIRQDKEGQ
ncbi:hypothetical protein TNCV_2594211 [Trichonephila clavipes]|nr:hypothetical protein TNCV_2594211 [Trichonephila clavipes]